jgi:broad specificity phosphatase PhoE
MKIFVVRHGETEWNKEEVFRGRKDIPLNETGLWQAGRTGAFFSDKNVSSIYSSPLGRAQQTACKISEATGVPVKVDESYTDMDFGPWEGLSLKAVQKRYPEAFDTWRRSPHRFRIEGAETLTRVRRRVRRGLHTAQREGGPTVVIVTHRVICKLLALHFLDVSNRFFWRIKCDPASITLAEQVSEEITVSMVNQTLHLQDPAVCSEYRDF